MKRRKKYKPEEKYAGEQNRWKKIQYFLTEVKVKGSILSYLVLCCLTVKILRVNTASTICLNTGFVLNVITEAMTNKL